MMPLTSGDAPCGVGVVHNVVFGDVIRDSPDVALATEMILLRI